MLKKCLLYFLIFFIIKSDSDFIYWLCENSEKGCKGQNMVLAGCEKEEYVYKLKPSICRNIGGQVTHYFCDNYISPSENFTLQKCSVAEERGCSFIRCFNNKGIIRNNFECTVDGTTKHMKHIYFPHFLIANYQRLKSLINFGIPNALSSYDNGNLICAFENKKDLIEYLAWTVENKFVYSWGGGHNANFYGPTTGTSIGTECKNDVNVVGFDCSGLVLYMLKMLGNNIKMNGRNCQQMYELASRLGLEKSENNIQLGDVLLFGNEEKKVHTGIALDNTYMLHAYKHFDNSGCGIRTLVDYYLFLKNTSLDFGYINQELSKLGLVDFSNMISGLSVKLFDGVSLNEDDESLLLFIASSGTYGTLEHSVEKGVKEKGKKSYFLSRLFPPVSYYKVAYPWAYKIKVLIPFAWLVRFFRILFKNPKRAAGELKMISNQKEGTDSRK